MNPLYLNIIFNEFIWTRSRMRHLIWYDIFSNDFYRLLSGYGI